MDGSKVFQHCGSGSSGVGHNGFTVVTGSFGFVIGVDAKVLPHYGLVTGSSGTVEITRRCLCLKDRKFSKLSCHIY